MQKIIYSSILSDNFLELDNYFSEILQQINPNIKEDISIYLFSSSKRIRSALFFLLSFSLGLSSLSKKHYLFASALELIHNASLIHDDIIDNSIVRRNYPTFNKKYNNSLAVIIGDYLLTFALKNIIKIKSQDIINLFNSSLNDLCQGEINQYFNKYKIYSIDDYVKKSELKTSRLFELSAIAACILSNKKEHLSNLRNFALNFGIAFQIKNDLLNILNFNVDDNNYDNDLFNGIYNSLVIFAYEQDNNILNLSGSDLLNKIKNKIYIDKTLDLINYHVKKAIDYIDFIKDNKYKNIIIELTQSLKDL